MDANLTTLVEPTIKALDLLKLSVKRELGRKWVGHKDLRSLNDVMTDLESAANLKEIIAELQKTQELVAGLTNRYPIRWYRNRRDLHICADRALLTILATKDLILKGLYDERTTPVSARNRD